MSIALIILTLNELDGVKKIVPLIKKEWVDEIVLVDGGSTDGTIEETKRLGLKIVFQKVRGHGAGILAGFEATNSDNIVIFGPDGNHDPKEIPILIEKMKEGYDQVIISRFSKTSVNLDAGWLDTIGNKMFAFLVKVFFGGNLTDVLNESRIITREAMKEIKLDALLDNSTLQMSIRGLKKGQKFAEIPGNEGARIGGKRKVNSFILGARLSWMIIKELIFWNY